MKQINSLWQKIYYVTYAELDSISKGVIRFLTVTDPKDFKEYKILKINQNTVLLAEDTSSDSPKIKIISLVELDAFLINRKYCKFEF